MKKSTLLTAAAFATALTLGIAANAAISSGDAHAAGDKEKCYGVVKAGQNDCGANGHSCAALAATDNDQNEWILLPEGLCDRLVGGKTKPAE